MNHIRFNSDTSFSEFFIKHFENSVIDNINLSLLFLRKDKNYVSNDSNSNKNLLLVLLKGEAIINVNNESYKIGPRKSVFTDKPESLYLNLKENFDINAIENSEIAIIEIDDNEKREQYIKLIKSSDVNVHEYGEDNFSRKVVDITFDNLEKKNFIIGETVNPQGNWSSYPPHKHTEDSDEEAKMEEIYLYKFNPENGFGFQGLYNDKKDQAYIIRNNDVCLIKEGFHPVAVAPGYEIYYLWILQGSNCKKKFKTEEKHKWILNRGSYNYYK